METKTSSAFKPEELAVFRRKNRDTGSFEEKKFPLVGGRLRLAHESGIRGITTDIIKDDGVVVIIKATVFMGKADDQRPFNAYGTSNKSRDAHLAQTLIELAETRAIARALRFAGFGVEYTGAEEMQDEKAELAHVREEEAPIPKAASPSSTASSTSTANPPATRAPAERPRPTGSAPGTGVGAKGEKICTDCGALIENKVWSYSLDYYGKPLCREDQKKHPRVK